MKEPLISVIVPVYKVESYLKRCIDSIIEQTYPNLEIILINDGSPDKCGDICNEYKKKDNRIIVIHQDNQGQSSARNNGVKIATGDFISFVDADDYLDITVYEKIVDFILENNLDIAGFGYYNVFSNKATKTFLSEIKFFTGRQALIASLKYELDDVIWNKVYKADIVKKCPLPLGKNHEDTATVYKYFSLANKIGVLNIPLYYYYQNNPNSIMTQSYKSKTMSFKARYDRFLISKERYEFIIKYNLKEALEICYLETIKDAIAATTAIYSSDTNIDDNVYNLEVFLNTAYGSSIYNKLNTKNKIRLYSFLKLKNMHKLLSAVSSLHKKIKNK
ncbi:glycosyltransferase [Selenomonadales bacterium OttesenSCG-928-I06]|nr:glycosyltransferase [Selenomonadales bacterium OttesenSCG-928-I06]